MTAGSGMIGNSSISPDYSITATGIEKPAITWHIIGDQHETVTDCCVQQGPLVQLYRRKSFQTVRQISPKSPDITYLAEWQIMTESNFIVCLYRRFALTSRGAQERITFSRFCEQKMNFISWLWVRFYNGFMRHFRLFTLLWVVQWPH